MLLHELKVLMDIYHENDDYEVVVWNPSEQREMELVFTGSAKSTKKNPNGEFNLNVNYKGDFGEFRVFDAFKHLMREKGFAKTENELEELIKKFTKITVELRNKDEEV